MVITNQNNEVVEIVGEDTHKTATIDGSRIAKLQYILTEGLYQDAISATIVELSNNAIDSIKESGKDPLEFPVVVELKNENRVYTLSIKDEGIGMSKEFFESSFMSMLFSSKENNNDAIGHFGIGSKSWCSLKRPVTFTIIKEGKKCKYLCYKGEQFIDYDLILEDDTEESNGVLFEMSINDYYEYGEFIKKAKVKLSYYDGVVLIIDNKIWENKIYRNNLFQYTDSSPYSGTHMCLKDVVYPLDYNRLGISDLYIPVAIRFSLTDGVIPTPSRENILYSRETIELIKSKIREIAEYFVNLYNSEAKEPLDFYKDFSKIGDRNKKVLLGSKTIDISHIQSFSNTYFTQTKFNHISLKSAEYYKDKLDYLTNVLHVRAILNKNGNYKIGKLESTSHFWNINRGKKVYLVDSGQLVGNMKQYISEIYPTYSSFYSYIPTKSLRKYKEELNLIDTPKDEWRGLIKEWQELEKQLVLSYTIDLRNIETTPEYITWLKEKEKAKKENRGKSVKLSKKEGDVIISLPRRSVNGSSYVFEKKVVPISTIINTKLMVVFTDNEEAKDFCNFKKIKTVVIGVREFAKIKDFKNIITYKRFMDKNKPFKRIATALLIEDLLIKYRVISSSSNEIIRTCIKDFYGEMQELKDYMEREILNRIPEELKKTIIKTARNLDCFDEEIMHKVRTFEKDIEKFDFLIYLEDIPSYKKENEGLQNFINKVLLYKKKFGELENYELTKIV